MTPDGVVVMLTSLGVRRGPAAPTGARPSDRDSLVGASDDPDTSRIKLLNAYVRATPSAQALGTVTAEIDLADARLARAGDAEAFGRLYWRHAARVKALARRLLGRDQAEDGTQEVFVRAWRRLSQFREQAAFGTWLYRLAVNVLLRELERSRRHPGDATELERLPAAEPPSGDPDLDRALAALPEGVREVIVLHDMESYTHDEIARLLGIGVSASKMRLHRGRLALREQLLNRESR